MPRKLRVAAAQVGAVHLNADRSETLNRLLKLLFPRHLFTDLEELETFFEHGDDVAASPNVKPLLDEAQRLDVDVSVGFAERTSDGKGYNTCIYYSAKLGKVISKYRKIHLPGTKEPFENKAAVNQLEKRYFEPGDLGFKAFRAPGLLPTALKAEDVNSTEGVESLRGKGDPIIGMLICNDRRWPEAWRCYGLQGVELILCGYNTASYAHDLLEAKKPITKEQAEEDALFHHRLVMQSTSYVNACFSVSAARCGLDDGKWDLIGGSGVVGPDGRILVEAETKKDELVVAEIDLEECVQGKKKVNGVGIY